MRVNVIHFLSFLEPELKMQKCHWAEIMSDTNYPKLLQKIRGKYHGNLNILRKEILSTINSEQYRYSDTLEFTLPSHSCKHIILKFLFSWKYSVSA
jgi:hypothetical protein